MELTIEYFYSLTPRQFFNIQHGWNLKRDAESKERQILTRKLMFASMLPWSKNLTEQKVWPFDWEKDTEPPAEVSLEDIEAMEKRIEERAKKPKSESKTLGLKDVLSLKRE